METNGKLTIKAFNNFGTSLNLTFQLLKSWNCIIYLLEISKGSKSSTGLERVLPKKWRQSLTEFSNSISFYLPHVILTVLKRETIKSIQKPTCSSEVTIYSHLQIKVILPLCQRGLSTHACFSVKMSASIVCHFVVNGMRERSLE